MSALNYVTCLPPDSSPSSCWVLVTAVLRTESATVQHPEALTQGRRWETRVFSARETVRIGPFQGISDLLLPMPLFSCVCGARRCVYFRVLCPRVTFLEGCSLLPPHLSASLSKQHLRIKGFKFTADKYKAQNVETCSGRNNTFSLQWSH